MNSLVDTQPTGQTRTTEKETLGECRGGLCGFSLSLFYAGKRTARRGGMKRERDKEPGGSGSANGA